MATTNTLHPVASTIEGDDGEAMAKTQLSAQAIEPSIVSKQTEQQTVTPQDAGWYVAVVRCNCEVKIAQAIKADMDYNGHWFDYWVPMQKIPYLDKRTNKRRTKQKVFLSTFIFCHVSKQQLNDIRFRPDVYKMLTMPGEREIYRLNDKEFNDYRAIVENSILPITPHTGTLKKGQRVRIIEGQMAGIEAYVQRIAGKKAIIGNEIKYICGATITIDRQLLEVVD